MNWLATIIPSLRDFYTTRSVLTRGMPPYTPEGPYTAQRAVSFGTGEEG